MGVRLAGAVPAEEVGAEWTALEAVIETLAASHLEQVGQDGGFSLCTHSVKCHQVQQQ